MSRRIEHLGFTDFRNYSHLSLDGFSDLTIFCGQNAVGKTNIVEGIQLLTDGVSFRRPKWGELIHWDADTAFLDIFLRDGKQQTDNSLFIK